MKDCYYEVPCSVPGTLVFEHYSNTVSTNAGLELETNYFEVFRDDLQTDLARRCVAHLLGRVVTSSLSFST
jgi:hypothetical protein